MSLLIQRHLTSLILHFYSINYRNGGRGSSFPRTCISRSNTNSRNEGGEANAAFCKFYFMARLKINHHLAQVFRLNCCVLLLFSPAG